MPPLGGVTGSEASEQDVVDALFTRTSRFWEDLYADKTLATLVYRNRQQLALGLIDELRLPRGAPVLEVGCGASLAAVTLARRGFEVTAVDRLPTMVATARRLAEEAGVSERVVTIVGDVHALELEAERFSLALALGVLPWLHSPDRAVKEISRVLRADGYMLASADNRAALTGFLEPLENPLLRPMKDTIKRTAERRGWRPHTAQRNRPFSHRRLRAMLTSAGLEPVVSRTFGFGPFELFHRALLPERLGIALYRYLQGRADRDVPGLRAAGAQHLVLAKKTGRVSSAR